MYSRMVTNAHDEAAQKQIEHDLDEANLRSMRTALNKPNVARLVRKQAEEDSNV